MSIITKLDELQQLMQTSNNIRELTDAILTYLEEPFTEKYNKGIK